MALKIIELVIQLIIGVGLFYVGYEANKISKNNARRITAEEKRSIEEIFEKVQNSIQITMREGWVTDEALSLIFSANLNSKLYMPQDVHEEIKRISDMMSDMYTLHFKTYNRQGQAINMDSGKRSKHIEEEHDLLIKLHHLDIHEIFGRLLRVQGHDLQS